MSLYFNTARFLLGVSRTPAELWADENFYADVPATVPELQAGQN